eukprot:scaffold27083_cov18-Tisochrysis_lutea.AAC.1
MYLPQYTQLQVLGCCPEDEDSVLKLTQMLHPKCWTRAGPFLGPLLPILLYIVFPLLSMVMRLVLLPVKIVLLPVLIPFYLVSALLKALLIGSPYNIACSCLCAVAVLLASSASMDNHHELRKSSSLRNNR